MTSYTLYNGHYLLKCSIVHVHMCVAFSTYKVPIYCTNMKPMSKAAFKALLLDQYNESKQFHVMVTLSSGGTDINNIDSNNMRAFGHW